MDVVLASRIAIFVPASVTSFSASMRDQIGEKFESRKLSILKSESYVLAAGPAPTVRRGGGGSPILLCDVLPGKLSSGRDFSFGTGPESWTQWHERAGTELQIYNLIHARDESFAIESDMLGLKPLYRTETGGGAFIASRLSDLVFFARGCHRSLDRAAVSQLFMLGHLLEPRTLHREIRPTRTGERIEWSARGGLKRSRPRRYRAPDGIDGDCGLHQALRALEDALEQSLERYCSGARAPINVALSGGLDSRVLAAEMAACGKPLRAFTYGKWHHRELRTARRVAKRLGVEHRVIDYPTDHFYRRFPLFLSVLEGHGESKSTQIANLLEIDADDGAPLVIGFLSDPLAGSHLTDWLASAELASLDEAAERLAGALAPPARRLEIMQRILGFEIDLEAFRDEIRKGLPETEHPYQSAIVWDIENRQRGMISAHLRLLGQKFDVIAPFYDRALLDRWLAMPRLGLDQRYLQRQFLARKFPELAKIPRDEEVAPIVPNLKHQLLRLGDTVARKACLRTYGRLAGYRVDSVWSLSQGLANAEQKQRMMTGIRKGAENLNGTFDLNPDFSEAALDALSSATDRGDYQTIRMVFQMVRYAEWIEAQSKEA